MQGMPKNKLRHMEGVAEYMFLRAGDYGLPADEMYVLGLLHDIGYLYGAEGHAENGAALLGRAFSPSSFLDDAVRHHGGRLRDGNVAWYAPSDRMLVLLIEADLSVSVKGAPCGFKARLEDVAERHGAGSEAYAACADNIAFLMEAYKEGCAPVPEAWVTDGVADGGGLRLPDAEDGEDVPREAVS